MSIETDIDALADLSIGFTPHPAEAEQRYREAGLFANRALWQIVEQAAAATPDQVAVTDAAVGRTLTYAELNRAARARAAGFVDAGLRPGQRVVLQQHNSAEFAVTLLGLLRAGLVPVMTLPAHRIAEIAHLAAGADAVAYLTEDGRRGYDYRDLAAELVGRVPSVEHVFVDGDPGAFSALPDSDPDTTELPEPNDPNLPALLLVSGGTTGLPKLIARTHNDYVLNARLSANITGLTRNDTYLAALPAAHNFALCCPGILGVWSAGGHVVFTDNPSPDSAFDLIEANRVTVTALVPALAQVWCAATEWEPADVSSLRLLQVGGAKLAQADAEALDAALGPVTQQVFGMAEGLICYTRLVDDRDVVHQVQGAPMSAFDEVRIVDEKGEDVPDGQDGELLVRGPYTIRGYYRAGEQAAQSFTPDGFYRSGDRVRRLPSGHLAVTGRIKDTIVRAGENVAADDVEENLIAHPSIRQAAVVGVPDDSLGERICALVVTSHEHRPGQPLELSQVRGFLAERGMAQFKLPDEVRLVPSLPVTAIGKVDKKVLRAELAAARS
ncbi:2,3-dihydroxybenzoate-AMP ligase [Gordonia araii NBRC 100433]|uniref:2,3-dihydroxybenzoate-AMP ligase n=1 Tax=Gordonia araii NBRC 100433 TaxID=1073574 RepID=G7GX72_9ACTN|nr:AMP-binding protein [Gordonia araii]NNG98172.1 AMP-binding protein [Gordonia araii NBRC 100433]GAB08197.1 2,3-dihydroxybenzoate-AMP ligase [Gordonia araii NBRC 100433]